ncbi:MAG: hypothetical protein A2V66_09485 [Ignavibacteria bacterium RBG_13_36_8]|nr:MAG: hypothetical protein A2V66_09485 [Ignavibacteria bacterium RBG_13_36_8]
MRKRIKKFSEIIEENKEFEKIKHIAEGYGIVERFNDIFPDLKMVAKAIKVDKNILFLRVENSVWKSELNFSKNVMIDKINRYFHKNVINGIKFTS